MNEETRKSLEQRIANMQSELDEIKALLKETKCENENFNNRLLSEVAQKGDVVRLYDELWYVIEIEEGVVMLISKDCAGKMTKNFREEVDKSCRRLHKFSKKYVKEISKGKNLLYTKVRSCQKGDLNKYLNRRVRWAEIITDNVWHTGYSYWLASPYSNITNYLYYVCADGSISNNGDGSMGVRCVVYLKSDIRTIGKDKNGVWTLEE